MNNLLNTIVIRLPEGQSAASLVAKSRGSELPTFEDEAVGLEAIIDPRDVRVERMDVSEDDLRSIREEPETVGTVLDLLYDHVQPVSDEQEEEEAPTDEDYLAWGLRSIGVSDAADLTGKGVKVAILDTGIDRNWQSHPAFDTSNIVTRNFTSDDPNDWADHDGHGTHCAGTVFGGSVDGKRIGVAPGISLAAIGRVLDESGGSTESLYRGMLWAAEQQVDVISMSLSINFDATRQQLIDLFGRSPPEATSLTLRAYRENLTLFDRLSLLFQTQAGRVKMPIVVVATGNDSRRPDYTIEAAPPAVAPWFISVNAVDQDEKVAPFSNTGGQISAPGVGIVSAALGGGLRRESGTSMAAPHVAGAAALWMERLRGTGGAVSNETIQKRLLAEARRLGQFEVRTEDYGEGMVQVPQ